MIKYSKGTTLLELLMGLLIFSILLYFAAIGVHDSHRVFSISRHDAESEMIALHGLDDAARTIRGCVSVRGGGASLQCEDGQGGWNTLSLVNGTLLFNQVPLQGSLNSIHFSIQPGSVSPYVSISATALSNHEQAGFTTKMLSTSVALRNNPKPPIPAPSPLPVVPIAPSPAPAPPPISTEPSPGPKRYDCLPDEWGGGALPCRPIPPILSGPHGGTLR